MSYKINLIDQNTNFITTKNETLLESALRQGHNLPYGCRNGACGKCKATLISGEIQYLSSKQPEALSIKEQQEENKILLCLAYAQSDVLLKARTVEVAKDIYVRQFSCRVIQCEKLNDDVMRLILKLPKTERIQFLPGQYIDIIMRGGKKRSFSLANSPRQDQIMELHVRHYEGGLFSEYAFNEIKEKSVLRIEGPLGQFTLQKSDRPIIMIAGGTGFAPIKSLIEHSLEKRDFRRIDIYWGGRTQVDLYLHKMTQCWANQFEHIHYIPVLSGGGGHTHGETGQRTGLVHKAVLDDYPDLSKHDIYACGPPPMIDAIISTFPAYGLNKDRLFSDSFVFSNQ